MTEASADLSQKTFELLASNTFREPFSDERKVLEERGYDIILPVEAKSLLVVITEYAGHFWNSELDYVNARARLRDYTPPAMTIALRSSLFLQDSFLKSQAVQLQRIEDESQSLQSQLPDVRAIMLPASPFAQADIAYLRQRGQVLFQNRCARTLEKTSDSSVAHAGRLGVDKPFVVIEWPRDDGLDYIGAAPAVVFIEK